MKINPSMFRAYDLRGIVDKDLNPGIVEHLGKAHGTWLKRHGIHKAVIGRDCRHTSPEYSERLISGLTWTGVDVVDIGMTLVGTFYWSQYFLKIPGGVYVTASHNPAQWNGFKFAVDYSETHVSEGMQDLKKMVEEEDYDKGDRVGKVETKDILEDYIQDLKSRIKIDQKFKVVIDPSKATAGVVVPKVLQAFGCEVVESNCDIDPDFPLGTPDPTEMIVAKRLKKEVLASKADIGFSYDTDGDRMGIVDEKGNIIWNDVLVALFAIDVLHRHPNSKIMFNTLCSKVVPETIKKYNGEPFMWQTGHSFLKKKNQTVKAAFIGELSGHFFFSKDFHNHDDGIYSTLRLLQYLSRGKQTLSQAISKLPKYISSPEVKLYCDDDKKVELISKIADQLRKDYKDKAEIIDDERAGDGVRLDLPDSMFVVRYSQNGPYITVKFEAKKQVEYDELRVYLNKILHQHSEINWQKDPVNADALK
ncbi:MAG: phosphomannomutase/phosphoglucomutase [bacterium]